MKKIHRKHRDRHSIRRILKAGISKNLSESYSTTLINLLIHFSEHVSFHWLIQTRWVSISQIFRTLDKSKPRWSQTKTLRAAGAFVISLSGETSSITVLDLVAETHFFGFGYNRRRLVAKAYLRLSQISNCSWMMVENGIGSLTRGVFFFLFFWCISQNI
jgi:hypothetical protein